MCSISVIFLYISCIVPTGKLFFIILSSIPIMITAIDSGLAYGILSYVAVVLIGFIILPYKTIWLSYLLFFGMYCVLKIIIDFYSANNKINILFKFLYFTGIFALFYFVFNQLFKIPSIITTYITNTALITAIIYALVLIAAFVYDRILSYTAHFYLNYRNRN